MNTIEYEINQQFPLLDGNFKNENILKPIGNEEQAFAICEQLCPYVNFIRRDFGDIYHYNGTDELFENFTIYLESSVEYNIDRAQSTCQRSLDTHGLVYARLDLDTMISSNEIDQDLLIDKLWDMGIGLSSIAGRCTTSETQQSTNYYTKTGEMYNADDEKLVQNILKKPTLRYMLSLSAYAPQNLIKEKYDRITNQLKNKWEYIPQGSVALEKLSAFYEAFINEQKSN